MPTSVAKLQAMVTKLEQQVIELKDKLEEQKEKTKNAEYNLKYYKEKLENRIQSEITKAVKDITDKYEAIIKEKDQRIFELENRLNINSDNSSLPSSQTPIYQSKICNSRKPNGDKPGRKEGHKKDSLKAFNEDEITEKVEHKIDKCPKCGSENLELIDTKIRDEIDIKVTVVKRRHYFNEYKCNDCNEIIKSEIPLSLHADNQYGDEVKNYCNSIMLLHSKNINKKQVFEIFSRKKVFVWNEF